MFLFDEKRKGVERRNGIQGPPPGCRERRVHEDRRQTKIAEISFHEWTSHLLKYRDRVRAGLVATKAAE